MVGIARRAWGVVPGRQRVTELRLTLALGVLAFFVPLFVTNVYDLRVLTVALMLGALTLGNTLSLGYAGIFNLSQGTFYGLGAYTTAILVARHGVPFELAALAGAAVGMAAGLLLGAISLRVRGDYVSLVSLALTECVFEVFQNWDRVTGGLSGFFGIPNQVVLGIHLMSFEDYYYAALVATSICFIIVWRTAHSFAGRAMLSVRYDEVGASMMGVAPARFRLLAMAISGGTAGFIGAFLVATTLFISPESFDLLPSFNIAIFAIVGGSTSLLGGVIAAVFLTYIVNVDTTISNYELLIYGAALLLSIFVGVGMFSEYVRRGWRTVGKWGGRRQHTPAPVDREPVGDAPL
jgi:branched-chain amino acid transport system permease protein